MNKRLICDFCTNSCHTEHGPIPVIMTRRIAFSSLRQLSRYHHCSGNDRNVVESCRLAAIAVANKIGYSQIATWTAPRHEAEPSFKILRSLRMRLKTVYWGALSSVALFVGVIILSQIASDWIAQYPAWTVIYLGTAALSLVGCAFFIPRAVRAYIQSQR